MSSARRRVIDPLGGVLTPRSDRADEVMAAPFVTTAAVIFGSSVFR